MMPGFILMLATAATATPAVAAEPPPTVPAAAIMTRDRVPAQLDVGQRKGYAAVFGAIREERWTDAQITLDGMAPGPLHAVARAELYTAKNSPRVELEPLVALLNQAPELPQAAALAKLARARGAQDLPPLPEAQRLIWQDGAPRRVHAKAIKSDLIAADLALRMQPLVRVDDGAAAHALLDATEGLSAEASTEWRARIAWIYFLQGDDANARSLAARAEAGAGEWALQARWTGALSAWRARDFRAAGAAFEGVAARATDVDLRAAGLYWAARADIAGARPDRVEGRLKAAAQFSESFYGQLAAQALGVRGGAKPATGMVAADWAALDKRPNVRVAAALVELGETDLADDVLRQQARIGSPAEFQSLMRLAGTLDLPATSLWMAHNCPVGFKPAAEARYPTPNWKPDSGWRVDKALVYAHTLEESRFRSKVVSPAGAYGLMQIMPAAAIDFARERGLAGADRAFLSRPSTNMDVGQRHLERLRDMRQTTGGLLPKVIAAYNAGPKHVGEWNALIRDGGDPLLYIESIPYWETRGYVTTVLRNYWMYEGVGGKSASTSRKALAQGMWPHFPGSPGAGAVRIKTPIAPFVPRPASLPAPVPSSSLAGEPATARSALIADAD
ncbi:transglycosylase SLT domain-containing protein [uncultured Sphingomonas sp.]|uniref:lytic transglycosylase domain-containing protein n=1 Tax=uncultured Sphingomonas sp. TaxID=158754 RepID=UPI0035CB9341